MFMDLAQQTFKLHISNLQKTVTTDDLHNFIQSKGLSLKSAKVIEKRNYAKAAFYSKAEADKALATLNGAELKGQKLHVSHDRGTTGVDVNANLHISNLPEITESELTEEFALFGKVLSVKINNYKQKSAFIQFEKQAEAAQAIEKWNNKEFRGNVISVQILKKNKDGAKFNNLYVKGFAATMTEEKLREIFSEYGEVTSLSIPNPAKGFGYVCFRTHESAQLAIDGKNG